MRRVISRGTVGGRPAGERLFRVAYVLSSIPVSPPARLTPAPAFVPAAGDANNEVIPRDAAAVSVETPRRRAISHQPLRHADQSRSVGCCSRDAKGGADRGVGMKARRREAGVEKLSEVTCVRRQKPPSCSSTAARLARSTRHGWRRRFFGDR